MEGSQSPVHAVAHQKASEVVYHEEILVLLGGTEPFSGEEVVFDEMEGVHGALVGSGHLDIYPGDEEEIAHHHEVCWNDVEGGTVHFLEVGLGDVAETYLLHGLEVTGLLQLHDVVEMIPHLQACLVETCRLV